MASLRIEQIQSTANGVRIEGVYDVDPLDILNLKVTYRLSSGDAKPVQRTGPGDHGRVRVRSDNHGLRSGDRIRVLGVSQCPEANGVWQVRVITENAFDLLQSAFATPQVTADGQWFIAETFHIEVLVPGNPPPPTWQVDLAVHRPGQYDVKAILIQDAPPPIVNSAETMFKIPAPSPSAST